MLMIKYGGVKVEEEGKAEVKLEGEGGWWQEEDYERQGRRTRDRGVEDGRPVFQRGGRNGEGGGGGAGLRD